jgi:hypothetical protein
LAGLVALASLLTFLVLVTGGDAVGGSAANRVPARWTGHAKYETKSREELVYPQGEKWKETKHVVTMRLTFGKARGSIYVVKSGSLIWRASGGSYERLDGLIEETCTWAISRTLPLSRNAGVLSLEQQPNGNLNGVFAAADSYGRPVRADETCTKKYLYNHNPPVETRKTSRSEVAPNALFPLSRKTAGYPVRAAPPRLVGSGRYSDSQRPPTSGGGTITRLDSATWSWDIRGRG